MEIGKKVVPMYEDNKNVFYLQIVYMSYGRKKHATKQDGMIMKLLHPFITRHKHNFQPYCLSEDIIINNSFRTSTVSN